MRVTTAFSRLLRLARGCWVRKVRFDPDRVVVEVALRRRRLRLPEVRVLDPGAQGHTAGRLGVAASGSRDLAARDPLPVAGACGARCTGRAPRACRSPGRARSSRATSSAWSRGWRPAPTRRRSDGCSGSTGTRSGGSSSASATTSSTPAGWTNLFEIGVDEVSWKRQHNYLTLVADHSAARWCGASEGRRDGRRRFFEELDPEPPRPAPAPSRRSVPFGPPDRPAGRIPGAERGSASAHALAGDLAGHGTRATPSPSASTRRRRSSASTRIHVVASPTRRSTRSAAPTGTSCAPSATRTPPSASRTRAGRCSRDPENLTDEQAATLARIKARRRRGVARLHTQGSRSAAIFEPGLTRRGRHDPDRPAAQPPRPQPPASRSSGSAKRSANTATGSSPRSASGINQGRTEALNNKVRLITRRAYGFHTAKAALALVLLTCGPITLHLPHELHALGIA